MSFELIFVGGIAAASMTTIGLWAAGEVTERYTIPMWFVGTAVCIYMVTWPLTVDMIENLPH